MGVLKARVGAHSWVDIASIGPAGPQGLPGPPGDGGFYAEYSFAVPGTTWILPHHLGTFALSVTCVDPNGDPIEGDVDYVDADTIHVTWYHPMTGAARVYK